MNTIKINIKGCIMFVDRSVMVRHRLSACNGLLPWFCRASVQCAEGFSEYTALDNIQILYKFFK